MITAQLVKELRDRTGISMMDCKSALTETNGDIEKAIEVLRKKVFSRQKRNQAEKLMREQWLLAPLRMVNSLLK